MNIKISWMFLVNFNKQIIENRWMTEMTICFVKKKSSFSFKHMSIINVRKEWICVYFISNLKLNLRSSITEATLIAIYLINTSNPMLMFLRYNYINCLSAFVSLSIQLSFWARRGRWFDRTSCECNIAWLLH